MLKVIDLAKYYVRGYTFDRLVFLNYIGSSSAGICLLCTPMLSCSIPIPGQSPGNVALSTQHGLGKDGKLWVLQEILRIAAPDITLEHANANIWTFFIVSQQSDLRCIPQSFYLL